MSENQTVETRKRKSATSRVRLPGLNRCAAYLYNEVKRLEDQIPKHFLDLFAEEYSVGGRHKRNLITRPAIVFAGVRYIQHLESCIVQLQLGE